MSSVTGMWLRQVVLQAISKHAQRIELCYPVWKTGMSPTTHCMHKLFVQRIELCSIGWKPMVLTNGRHEHKTTTRVALAYIQGCSLFHNYSDTLSNLFFFLIHLYFIINIIVQINYTDQLYVVKTNYITPCDGHNTLFKWWQWLESNQQHPALQAGTLPVELHCHINTH